MRIIEVDGDLKELCEHGTVHFPLLVNHDDLNTFQEKHIICHWHDDLELSIVRQGTAVYQISGLPYEISEGNGMVINAGIPHMIAPKRDSRVELLRIVVHPELLYGNPGSDVDSLCLRPFMRVKELAGVTLNQYVPWQARVLKALYEVDFYNKERPFGFQLKIKGLLCEAFYEIISSQEDIIKNGQPFNRTDLRRLKVLLDYIHLHYNQVISLKELAGLIYLTRESCCRLFKQLTGKTIGRYICDYRVAQGIRLLQEERYSVTQVASMVGFSSSSRFAQAFRDVMDCSPSEYLHKLS